MRNLKILLDFPQFVEIRTYHFLESAMLQCHFNKALRELCATREGHACPGTGLKLAFERPLLAN